MCILKVLLPLATFAVLLIANEPGESRTTFEARASFQTAFQTKPGPFQTKGSQTPQGALQANSLCAKAEQIIFTCPVKRSGMSKGLAKIASLCASADLDKDHGYLQYRFGLPGKVELEFPDSRTATQQKFQYTHYMRYQVDLTEINFTMDDYQYQIFDTYNGEEKPAISEEGVNVTTPGDAKHATFACRTKAKADYSKLEDVLPREP